MPRGGARVNSGPAPDPNALRRERTQDRDGWTTLPSGGRTGEVPPWPLIEKHSEDVEVEINYGREEDLWFAAWRTPQAVAWERLGWVFEVALYCRLMANAEQGDMKAAGEVRQWSDRLGLNPAAMLRNRWRVSRDEVADRRPTATPEVKPAGTSARERMKALSGGVA